MLRVACTAVFLLACPIALAQRFHHGAMAAATAPGSSPCANALEAWEPMPPKLSPGLPPGFVEPGLEKDMPTVNWPVTVFGDTDAQRYFNQGLTEYYGFNYEEAMRNFIWAQHLDPAMAMAPWGIALAAGPNINLGMDDRCRKLAVHQSALAVVLARNYKTRVEKRLIDALPRRYAGPLTETVAYADAMGDVWYEALEESPTAANHAANVANVGALYAESRLDMRPWGLYDAAYRPALDTPTINTVLTTAMQAEPDTAIGANHLYIHAIEASAGPKCGLPSANLLNDWTRTAGHLQLAPGHLVHMPSHIYLRLGDYAKAMKTNSDAVDADRSQYEKVCTDPGNPECPRLYYGHYLSHNLFFRTVAATFAGQRKQALEWARQTCAHAKRFVDNEPGLERYMTAPLMTLVMNSDWKAINGQGEPRPADICSMEQFPGDHILGAMWHWADGMAFASQNQAEKASKAYQDMASEMALIQPPGPTGWGNNSAAAMLAVAQSTLQARYTWFGGQCRTDECTANADPLACQCGAIRCQTYLLCLSVFEQAVEHLKLAVTHEDALVYDEPPQWFPSTREALGGAYLRVAQLLPDKGEEQRTMFELAEKAFDEEILRHPGSGRPLYGKMRAMAGRGEDAATVKKAKEAFCNAWGDADYIMSEEELWPAGNLPATVKNYPEPCERKAVIPPVIPDPPKCICEAKACPPPLHSSVQ